MERKIEKKNIGGILISTTKIGCPKTNELKKTDSIRALQNMINKREPYDLYSQTFVKHISKVKTSFQDIIYMSYTSYTSQGMAKSQTQSYIDNGVTTVF